MKVGIDLVFIPRYEDKERLASEVLSINEFNEYKKATNKAQYLASRFALKEALIKSIESSILAVKLKDIEVVKKENGAVYVLYQDKKYECSLSHDGDYCVGVVLNA
ncbi:MAG: 4'-phosphopantetheinyl transferase superfamily protein [Bacilli bacterium]|jgi:phosphopantetheine--protein transferase-like protein